MKDEEPIPIREIQKSTRQIELRKLFFLQIQSIVGTVGAIICKVIDSLTRPGCFLRLEVKSSSDGWALVFSLELR